MGHGRFGALDPLSLSQLQVWSERPFSERGEYGLMGQGIAGIEKLTNEGLFFPKNLRCIGSVCADHPYTAICPIAT